MKDIMLLTSEYPFGLKESYLSNEIYNCNCVNNLFIVPLFRESKIKRNIVTDKAKIKVIELESTGLNILIKKFYLFISDKNIWNEIFYIFKSKKHIFKKIKKMIWFWNRSIEKYFQIEFYIRKNQIDLQQLVVYSYWMAEHAYIASKLKIKFKEIKAISRCHGYDLYEYRNEISYIPFRKQIFENVDYIIPISSDGYSYITSKYRELNKNKVHTSFLGTKDYGCNLEYKNDNLKIVSCSNLVDVKRVELIIKALIDITEFEVEWIHYGDGPEKEKLIKLCNNLPMNIRYKFFGQISNEEIMKEYATKKFDLFLNVSSSEGLPVSIMEAQSKGIVVIATDVGGTSEIINDGVNGFLLNRDFKVQDLSEILVRYKNLSCKHKIKMKKKAREIWSEKFDASNNYRGFYEWINKI